MASAWRNQEAMVRVQNSIELKIENIDLDNNMIIDGMKTAAGTNRKVPIHPEVIFKCLRLSCKS